MTERTIEYQCPICNLPYMYKGSVKRHIKLIHSPPDGNPKKIISTSCMETEIFLGGN